MMLFCTLCILAEFNPIEAPKLNEKVLKDKRKKLRETFTRVFRLYVSLLVHFIGQDK